MPAMPAATPTSTAAAVGKWLPPLSVEGEGREVGLPSRPIEGTTWVAGGMLGAGVPDAEAEPSGRPGMSVCCSADPRGVV